MAFGLAMCLIQHMNDAALAEENARLKARLAETEAALVEALEARQRLESIVAELRRERLGLLGVRTPHFCTRSSLYTHVSEQRD